jgi:hypothetical protein
MKSCERENAVAEAAKRGTWDDALRDHVERCESCADLALVASFMHEEGRTARIEAANALPSPGQIWWKAQILAKRSAAERATRPIVYFEKAAYALGTLGVLAVALWNWSSIQTWLGPLRATWSQLSTAGTGPSPILNPFLYLSAGFVFLIILGAFALYVAWAES